MRLALSAAALVFFLTGPVHAQGKLKVFVLAGQSNMEGAGQIAINPRSKNGGKGSLEYLVKDPKTAKKYAHTGYRDGSWRVRVDGWIWYLGRKGGLSVGYGAKPRMIGPEFQMGHVLGEAFKE
ncbi:MAG: sialate O-acetylesterase, partial [Planctomycetes bacterium]|nr:sialate O-acetylesterase [Planctomycetota bacterium]